MTGPDLGSENVVNKIMLQGKLRIQTKSAEKGEAIRLRDPNNS